MVPLDENTSVVEGGNRSWQQRKFVRWWYCTTSISWFCWWFVNTYNANITKNELYWIQTIPQFLQKNSWRYWKKVSFTIVESAFLWLHFRGLLVSYNIWLLMRIKKFNPVFRGTKHYNDLILTCRELWIQQ
jgi:hypothetical protein